MPKIVNEIEMLKEYLLKVMSKAKHHAHNVDNVCLALIGAIIWKKDADPIKVLEKDGDLNNVLWITIHNQKYAFSYKHLGKTNGQIEMRKNSTQGEVLHTFTNENSLEEIKRIFEAL